MKEKDFKVSLSEQYQLHHFVITIEADKLLLAANLLDKPGSSIQFSCQPKWNKKQQRLELKKIDIKTKSRNLMVKGAGWVAAVFMREKIDKKIEEQINRLYSGYLEKWMSEGIEIPLKGHGRGLILPEAIQLRKLKLINDLVETEVEIKGKFSLQLEA
jgi:hypothetical protein